MTERSHPSDAFCRTVAHTTSADALTENFEHVQQHPDVIWRAGGYEQVAAQAIARVRLLERQIAEQERAVRARLFERTGRVENIVPIRKPREGKTR